MYDHTGVAAQFKGHAFLPGLFLQVPAHRRAAGEAQHFQALVGNQAFSVAAGKRQDVQGAGRPSRLLDQLSEKQRGERGLRSRFMHERTARRQRRSPFVRHQVEREIEWRDGRDRSQRETANHGPAACGERLKVHGKPLAVNARALFRSDAECEDGAFDLCAGGADGFPGLQRDGPGEILAAVCDALRDASQDALALIGWELARHFEGPHGSLDRHLNMRGLRAECGSHQVVVERRAHLQCFSLCEPLPIQKKATRRRLSVSNSSHLLHLPFVRLATSLAWRQVLRLAAAGL